MSNLQAEKIAIFRTTMEKTLDQHSKKQKSLAERDLQFIEDVNNYLTALVATTNDMGLSSHSVGASQSFDVGLMISTIRFGFTAIDLDYWVGSLDSLKIELVLTAEEATINQAPCSKRDIEAVFLAINQTVGDQLAPGSALDRLEPVAPAP